MLGLLIASWLLFAVIMYAQQSQVNRVNARLASVKGKAWYWYDQYNALKNNYDRLARDYDLIAYERKIEQGKALVLPEKTNGKQTSIAMLPGMPALPKDKTIALDESGVIVAIDKPKTEESKDTARNGDKNKSKNGKVIEPTNGAFDSGLDWVDRVEIELKDKLSDAEKSKVAGWEKSGAKFDSDAAKLTEYVKRISNMRAKSAGSTDQSKLTPDNVKGKPNGHGTDESLKLHILAKMIDQLS